MRKSLMLHLTIHFILQSVQNFNAIKPIFNDEDNPHNVAIKSFLN